MSINFIFGMFALQNLWEHVSAEKLVIPKLSKVFKEAAFGNASVIFPLILPLLSKLKLLESEKSEDICSKLLANLVCG